MGCGDNSLVGQRVFNVKTGEFCLVVVVVVVFEIDELVNVMSRATMAP